MGKYDKFVISSTVGALVIGAGSWLLLQRTDYSDGVTAMYVGALAFIIAFTGMAFKK